MTSRIRDENDPAHLQAAVGHRKMASTASSKMALGAGQRLEQPAKRIALADATKHDQAFSNKNQENIPAKNGLNKPAVRPRPLGVQSTASVATGAKPHQQVKERVTQKPAVYRDNQETKKLNAVKPSRPKDSHAKGSRKRRFIYRDEPEVGKDGDVEMKTGPVSSWPVASRRPGCDRDGYLEQLKEPKPSGGPTSEEENACYLVTNYSDDVLMSNVGERAGVPVSCEFVEQNPPPVTAVMPKEPVLEKKPVEWGATSTPDSKYNRMSDKQKKEYDEWEKMEKDLRMDMTRCTCTPGSEPDGDESCGDEFDGKNSKTETFGNQCSDPVEAPTVTGFVANRLYPETNEAIEREIKRAHKKYEGMVDEDEDNDPLMVTEYTEEIIEFCHILDRKYLPDPHYMDGQPHLEWSMRCTLIDWLVQVHERFRQLPETLFLAVNIVDRFLSIKAIPVNHLQLVGIVSLSIAAKFEETYPPTVDSLIYMVDGAYTSEEIHSAESYILKALNWEISAPGPYNFLRRLSKADEYDTDLRTLTKYFIETTIMDERFVGAPMSFVVAASYYIAMIMLNKGDWTTAHIHYSGYTSSQLAKAVEILVESCGLPHTHHPAIYDKYSEKPYKRVALFVEKWMRCQFGTMQETGVEAYA
ncbi:Cyclin-B2-1 [Dactylella cylindrospora]|nr:Cyclin-B2-1 [Dactylella cylindrospora]